MRILAGECEEDVKASSARLAFQDCELRSTNAPMSIRLLDSDLPLMHADHRNMLPSPRRSNSHADYSGHETNRVRGRMWLDTFHHGIARMRPRPRPPS